MSPAVQIRLLGEFSVAVGGLNSARLQALLGYLLLNRTVPLSRQQLAFLFWPDTSDSQAQTNLRQLLHTLRRRLPVLADCLVIDERTLRWRADVAYAGLIPARRRLLHRRVAQALEALHPGDDGPLSVQLAHHFEHAGMVAYHAVAGPSNEMFSDFQCHVKGWRS